MKKVFYAGITGTILFEFFNVYFIMPMPGSQQMNSLELAYLLYTYRWLFRVLFIAMIIGGAFTVLKSGKKWIPVAAMLATAAVIYIFNFKMSAESMFKQPLNLTMKQRAENTMPDSCVIIGVEHNGDARAYPIRFLTYHHQVRDEVGGMQVLVTYCSVCRTGRVYEPKVQGKEETFRLVGMDHFNAMFEDSRTKSWWRQVTGEAVAGKLKGQVLPEVPASQMTLAKWFELYPGSLVMQPDDASISAYDTLGRFERGKSEGHLTRTDSISWEEKSWVVGIQHGNVSKAYDWNRLKDELIINDSIGRTPIVIVLANDGTSFAAFERPGKGLVNVHNDTLQYENHRYDLSGRCLDAPAQPLKKIMAYQEFWHSWRTFHPETLQY